jgi:hypothetical protein
LLPIYGVSDPRPRNAQTHNGTGFLLLALSRYNSEKSLLYGIVGFNPNLGGYKKEPSQAAQGHI